MSVNVLTKVRHSLLISFRSALNWLVDSSGYAFLFIFILAFSVRAYSIRNIPVINLLPRPDRELGAIASSLVETGRFADPYMIKTGPTAHLPPIPPVILAFIYYWFGRTNTAGYVFMGFIIATHSTIYAMMPWIADKLGAGRATGFVGGLIGACIGEPELCFHAEGLTGILLALMLLAFLHRWNDGQHPFSAALLLGLGVGVSFHVQPALLPVFLGCLIFEIGWHKARRKAAITGTLVLGVLIACIPWAWRNYVVFHEFFFIRDNLGLELRLGNRDGAAATMQMMEGTYLPHPRVSRTEVLQLKELGEIQYMRRESQDAFAWILEKPLRFLNLTFLRFIHFWFGPLLPTWNSAIIAALTILASLGAWRSLPGLSVSQRWLIMIPLGTYPLIYYVVPYMSRYRVPIDWILFLLAGAVICQWFIPGKLKTPIPNFNHRYVEQTIK